MIQFNPLTIFGPQAMAQTSVMNGELAQASSSSSFIGQGTPGDLLNGTLSGLTVAAAIAGPLGSPTLARICSHPLFAGAALMLGASHQVQAWGQTGGLLSSALLFLSSVATAVSGYSFLRGFKAGWQALKSSTRLAVFDRVRTLQDEVERRLDKAAKRSGNAILAEAKTLALETHANVKSAAEHFRDLRDEKPQRIAAGKFSALIGNPKIGSVIAAPVAQAGVEAVAERDPAVFGGLPLGAVTACAASLGEIDVAGLAALDDEAYKALKKSAYQSMGETFKAAIEAGAPMDEVKSVFRTMAERVRDTLDAARADALVVAAHEVHLTVRRRIEEARAEAEAAAEKAALGSRLVPAMLSRVSGRFDPETSEHVREALKAAKEIERLLATTVKENGVIARWFALPRSPTKAEKAEQERKIEADPQNEKPLPAPRVYVRKATVHADESQRVASASPRNWVSEAIGDPTYSPLQKRVGRLLGENLNPGLMVAIPAMATLQMIAGGIGALGWFLSLAPAAAVYLYNARQGRKKFNVSPAPSQDLTLEHYSDETLQKRTFERLERAVPPMEDGERERFIADTRKTLDKVEADLAALEVLTVPDPGRIRVTPELRAAAENASWRAESSRTFVPIPTPDPNRPYAYDHRPGGPDTEDKRRVRRAIKAMSLETLEGAIRAGEVTHVDILNMICDHPAASDGAVFPRPITGELRRKLMKLAREADRTGVIRHFVAAKDLFPGVDGVVTAGSKTAYLTDLGKSPLIERLIDQGYIPIPCGLTAGANGGSGLYNGHGAVGNPRAPGHDTGGSSSAAAYILSLEDMPIRLAVGTDTGGSISAPCGAARLYGWVPEKDALSRVNMIPFATHLDTPGVMGVDRDEVLRLAKALTLRHYQGHYRISAEMPKVFYFETDPKNVSADSQANFSRQLEDLRASGLPVATLDERFAAIRRIPLDLYVDSYVAAAFTLMNPLQDNFMEPPRYVLDRNLQNRLAKAAVLLNAKDLTAEGKVSEHGTLFNRHLDLHVRFRNLVHKLFPPGSVFVTPTPEAVPLEDFRPNGAAGVKLDSHDILGGMLKNRTDRALFVDPERRLVIEGRTGDILTVAFARPANTNAVAEGDASSLQIATAGTVESGFPAAPTPDRDAAREDIRLELLARYPTLDDAANPAYGRLVETLGKRVLALWKADEDRFHPGFKVPSIYLDDVMATLYGALSRAGRQELLESLKADDRKRKDRESHERLKARTSKDASVFRAAS